MKHAWGRVERVILNILSCPGHGHPGSFIILKQDLDVLVDGSHLLMERVKACGCGSRHKV